MIIKDELDDPTAIQKLLGKHVRIETVDNSIHSGYLHVIDPQSKCAILADSDDVNPNVRITVVPFDAVKVFELVSTETRNVKVFGARGDETDGDMKKRKDQLKEWLKKNLIEVEDDGEVLRYRDYLVIEAPFDVDSCYCSNTIVLDRIKGIIRNM